MGQYDISYGSKYNKELKTKDIAKLLKKEITAKQKSGELPKFKVGIRSDYNHISINVGALPFLAINPEYIRNRCHVWHLSQYTKRANAVLETLNQMLAAYNYDGSDIQSDSFNVNFYSNISLDTSADYAMVTEYVEAEKLCAETAPVAKSAPRLTLVVA